jgi:CRISPR-associated protein Csd1
VSWMTKLYETYENCESEIGKTIESGEMPLLPVGFSIQDAHIEVMLDLEGNFLDARVLDKSEKLTIIPCTEDSVTRSGSGAIPHPLFDKLQYAAGDYSEYGGEKGNKFFEAFIRQLADWCASSYQNPKAEAIYRYLKKGCLIQDLVAAKILWCDENKKLLKKWTGNKNEVPPIFKVLVGNQEDAFVRFTIIGDGIETRAWLDKNVWNCWLQYYLSIQTTKELCYVTGEEIICVEKHASKIRNTADKAKLISANDSSGFTYRGRFNSQNEAACVGYDVSQKAHSALRWLIGRQAYRNGDQIILAWETSNLKVPQPVGEADFYLEDESDMPPANTAQEYALHLRKAVAGYRQNLERASTIVIMELNSATTGRLSIPYYRELECSEYLRRITSWYESCCWWFSYPTKEKGYMMGIGTPPPKDIVLAAYGDKAADKLKQATVERLLPCIIDQAKIPTDLVNCAVRRASNPSPLERWEWNKTLSVACALYKKHNEGKHYEMALEKERTDRAYLYGRLLAIADKIEGMTYPTGESRQTNAMQYMNMFSQHPFRTWPIIVERLVPYQAKSGWKCKKYTDLMAEVHNLFSCDDYKSNDSLDGLYLLGFYCQRQVFLDEQKAAKEKAEQ